MTMRILAGMVIGATTATIIWRYGARIIGRILAVPDDVDGRH